MKEKSASHSFFRQSGWLMVSTVAGGAMMWAVHFLSKAIPEREYGDFGAFLAVVMVLPAIPLQMLFAQQTAQALAENRPGDVSNLVRASILTTVLIWMLASIPVLIYRENILVQWKVSNPAGLWLTLPVVLLSLVLPMFWGVLQGAQNFLWLGWSLMLNSFGRLTAAAFAVLVMGAFAPGLLVGVLIGLAAGLSIALYHTRSYWLQKPTRFDWKPLFTQIIPLMLAFIGFQILFTADTMFVKAFFPQNDAGFYVSAGTLSRALMWLVLPLAAVMFPRLVHSAVKSEKTNLTSIVLIGTGILAAGGALGLAVLGPFIVRIVYKESYVHVASSLLPWYATVMIPLALGNVLLNQLMARPQGRLVLGFCVLGIAGGYMYSLTQFHSSLTSVLKVMGVANTFFLLLCAVFIWLDAQKQKQAARAASA